MSSTGLADISALQHRTGPPYPSPAVFPGVIPAEALEACQMVVACDRLGAPQTLLG